MLYSHQIDFKLKGAPTNKLLQFVSVGQANLILPGRTLGGILSVKPNARTCHLVTISLPAFESVTFSSTNSMYDINRNSAIYTVACSLNSFTIVHAIDIQENMLHIFLLGDNEEDIKKLEAVIDSFGTDD